MTKWQLLCGWMLSVLMATTSVVCMAGNDHWFKPFAASDGLADNGAQVVICTRTGRMVISSIGHINFYNGSSFDHINPHTENIYELPKYQGHYHLYFDKAHHLWVKDKYQVTCVNLLTELFHRDVQGVLAEMGFNGKADDLFVDEDGCLLILEGNKLYNCTTKKSYPVKKGRSLIDVGAYEQTLTLLFYDDGSVESFDHSTGKLRYARNMLSPTQTPKYNNTSVLFYDNQGFYQIRNGEREAILLHIDAKTGESRTVMEMPYHLNNMETHEGLLYIASEHGYWTYDLKTGEKEHVESLRISSTQTIETDINDIAFDLQGGMWVGTEKRGLLYSKPYASPFKSYPWSDAKAMEYGAMLYQESLKPQEKLPRRTNCSYRDSRGWKWEGSYTGLKLYKSDKQEKPIVYTTKDGLNNDVIHSIIEDNDHHLWVSTSDGISVLLFENGELQNIVSYGEEDNVPRGSFSNGLAMKLDDGTIIMQNLDYIVEFNPADFHTTKGMDIKLYPKLIKLTVNGQTIQPGMELDGNVIIDRAPTRIKEMDVNYDQNTIMLLFSGLNYFRPSQTYYRVRIKGYMDDWQVYTVSDESGRVDSKGLLHLPIIGIQPGNYDIELQVSMYADSWPVDPYVWRLSVNEPWWRMTIVYLTLGILLLGLMIANFVFYNKNTRMTLSRNNIEGGVLKRVKTFATMCEKMEDDVLSPYAMDAEGHQEDEDEMTFIDAMTKIVPYVLEHQGRLSMAQLTKVAQLDIDKFYDVMSSNLYKTPRVVVLKLRLQQVAELLRHSEKSVDEIAEELKFASPNYMIASFYHQYRQTPEDYRASNPL